MDVYIPQIAVNFFLVLQWKIMLKLPVLLLL